MDKFQNKYRIPSARAQWWDYANAGAYFITICTAHRVHYFGEIVGHDVETRLIASQLGQTAEQYWHAIPAQFQFIELGAFVVMPNHIHGILIINDNANANDNANVKTRLIASLQMEQTEQKTGGFAGNKNPMLNNNISRVVRWYKGVCTFEMRKLHADFQWQTRFHDLIIRNDDEYQRIVNYINTNPENWEKDKFYKSEEL
jgi:REP element-mobilizing transposase RayT